MNEAASMWVSCNVFKSVIFRVLYLLLMPQCPGDPSQVGFTKLQKQELQVCSLSPDLWDHGCIQSRHLVYSLQLALDVRARHYCQAWVHCSLGHHEGEELFFLGG